MVFVSLALMFFSCKNSNSNGINENTLQKVTDAKTLNVGYFIFEPTIMKNPKTGELEGVFIDMIEEIAKSIGPDVKIIYHPTTLATFHTELNSKKFDICIGATFATPKRAAVVSFSHPLFYCGYTGVAKKEFISKYKLWSDVDNAKVKVSVLTGSAIADMVKVDFKNQSNIVSFSGSDASIPLAAVSSGNADVGLMNQITVYTYLREHPELGEILSNQPLATTYFSWAVRPNDMLWLNFINTSIDYLINSGAMYKYERKYNVPLMHVKQDYYFPINE